MNLLRAILAWHHRPHLTEPEIFALIILVAMCFATIVTGWPAGTAAQFAALTLGVPAGYYLARDLFRAMP